MWHLDIPKILHCYWGGGRLVYMRYLTIKSFLRLNPDWKVIFWYPIQSFLGRSWGIELNNQHWNEKLCEDYLPRLKDMNHVRCEAVDFRNLGFRHNMAEVHKNDYIRIYSLYLYGGVWSDLDILYFKSIESLKENNPRNIDKEVFVCIGDYGHSTGFIMAKPNSQFFEDLSNKLNNNYQSLKYQCWGPDLFNKYYEKIGSISSAINLSMEVVYAHDCHQVKELLKFISPRFTDESIGCHWYGGNSLWGKFLNETRGGIMNLPKSIIGNLIQNENNSIFGESIKRT